MRRMCFEGREWGLMDVYFMFFLEAQCMRLRREKWEWGRINWCSLIAPHIMQLLLVHLYNGYGLVFVK